MILGVLSRNNFSTRANTVFPVVDVNMKREEESSDIEVSYTFWPYPKTDNTELTNGMPLGLYIVDLMTC